MNSLITITEIFPQVLDIFYGGVLSIIHELDSSDLFQTPSKNRKRENISYFMG